MELERRGVNTLTICSDAFLPLGKIQAKAMDINPAFVVIPHPLGGVDELEVVKKHAEAAWPEVAAWFKLALNGKAVR